MTTARYAPVLVALANGSSALVVGGGGSDTANGPSPVASCEVYNLTTNAWTVTGSMATPRVGHSAVLLPSGRVLVAGGRVPTPGCTSPIRQNCNPDTTLASTEIWDPSTDEFTPGPALPSPREGFSMLLLPTGFVFVTGGFSAGTTYFGGGQTYTSSLLFSEQAGAWFPTGSPLNLVPNSSAGSAVLLRV